jgi:hypothetical protein
MRWCSSLDDPNNQDKSLAPGFDAILPKCVDEKDKNCIAGISAVTPDGKVINSPISGYMSKDDFKNFLECGIQYYKTSKK